MFRMCTVCRLKEKQARRQAAAGQDVQNDTRTAPADEEMDTGNDLLIIMSSNISQSVSLSVCLPVYSFPVTCRFC